ncbi:MAG: ribonuclease [Clostridiales bacterium]|nr:ribonuclease [Clostridiales bacterium]
MKKRFLAFLLAVIALFTLTTACSIELDDPGSRATTADTTVTTSVTSAEETETSTEASTEDTTAETSATEETTGTTTEASAEGTITEAASPGIDEDGVYTTRDDVALYIHTYGHLPSNFITKTEARELGWEGGSLEPYAPGMCIGGDRFGNYEGLLPQGHNYYECDIDTLGASTRGAHRIIYSDDGLIYYTGDHYESFTLLYGEE